MILAETEQKLHDNRIIRIPGKIEPEIADEVMANLLEMDDEGHKPIMLYINSPGGEVISGLQIIDTMYAIKSDVITINTGMCASMGAVILSAGN